jgi:AcrR family transcriptional regulator
VWYVGGVSSTRNGRSPTRRERRRARERAIVATTRTLFDERGRRDAPVDEIARAARMNKALIYRSFDSKEEIFVLTVADYLAQLEARGAELSEPADPVAALRQVCERYVEFCLEYPAFLDCALALMQRPAGELRERVSGAVLFRLGRAMAATLGPLERILATGAERGVFAIDDPDFTANRLYTQVLGSMHLARVGVGVREAAPGVAETFDLDPERVREACVQDALALARITDGASA